MRAHVAQQSLLVLARLAAAAHRLGHTQTRQSQQDLLDRTIVGRGVGVDRRSEVEVDRRPIKHLHSTINYTD